MWKIYFIICWRANILTHLYLKHKQKTAQTDEEIPEVISKEIHLKWILAKDKILMRYGGL